MRKNRYLLFIILGLAISLSGCTAGPTETGKIETPDVSTNKLLIAIFYKENGNSGIPETDNVFLDSLWATFVNALKEENIPVEVTDLADLSNRPIANYPAIIIISYQEDQQVKKVLGNKDNPKNVLLYTTFDSPRLRINGEDVDAITSASKRYNPDYVSEALIERVTDILHEELGEMFGA